MFWSFLFKKAPCYKLGRKALTMYKKGIKHIKQLIDSEGKFVLFLTAKRRFRLGSNFRLTWNELCTCTINLQMPPNTNLWERFRDWQLPGDAVSW